MNLENEILRELVTFEHDEDILIKTLDSLQDSRRGAK